MEKENKKTLIRAMSFLLPALAVGSYYTYKDYNSKLETVAVASTSVRDDLYRYEDIPYIRIDYDNEKLEDKHLTEEALNRLETLHLNIAFDHDLSIIKKCSNLKKLTIWSSELLTDEDIDFINNSNVEEVILEFQILNVKKIRENRFDISRIKKNVKLGNFNFVRSNEVNNLILLNYIENYDEDSFDDNSKVDYYLDLDNKLNEILNNIYINDSMDDKEKIYRISNYICKNMDYDEEVRQGIYDYIYNDVEREDKKTTEYNDSTLGSVLNQNTEIKEGVCINYASLFDILCYKSNIKSRIVDGPSTKHDGLSHAWNIVYIDGNRYFVDLTNFDNTLWEKYLDYFITDNIKYGNFDEELFLDINGGLSEDYSFDDIDLLDKIEERTRNVKYYNVDIEGEKVVNEPLDMGKILPPSIAMGAFGLFIEELYRRGNKDKKTKKLN